MKGVDVLAVALFEAYSRNSGNPPEAHYDRNAAEQWMAQALEECGVAELIAILSKLAAISDGLNNSNSGAEEMACQLSEKATAAIAKVTGATDGR